MSACAGADLAVLLSRYLLLSIKQQERLERRRRVHRDGPSSCSGKLFQVSANTKLCIGANQQLLTGLSTKDILNFSASHVFVFAANKRL